MQVTLTKHVVVNACQHYLEQENEAEEAAEIQRIYDTLLSIGDYSSVSLNEYELELLGEWL